MKNTELQLLVYGEGIASYDVSVDYKGVRLKKTIRTENPNYLFVYLDVSKKAEPGQMELCFESSKDRFVRGYQLRERSETPGAQGFTTEDVLYLITPDRFANGDTSNDNLEGAVVDRNDEYGRHGGDIKGVLDNLDYIQELGMTTIWLNPAQKNDEYTYHGYAIIDYYDIDPRYGTMEEYVDFVDKVHERGTYILDLM